VGFAIDELVGSCVGACRDPDVRGAVRDVLRDAMSDTRAVADALVPDKAGITLLYHADDLTIINVVWAPGMQIFAHDHRMWAAIAVYAGREENSFFRRSQSDVRGLVPANGRMLETGDVALLGDDAVHTVRNPDAVPTGAIHVYGGDFVNQPRSQWPPPAVTEEPYDAAAVARLFAEANERWRANASHPAPTID
jgi:predicted metal-dependent enzyme (double-stranded beta helix superfamily)